MAKYISDLHVHPTFKPYNNLDLKPDANIWDPMLENRIHRESLSKPLLKAIEGTEKDSQSNLNTLFAGKVRSVFFVLHPIEMGWFNEEVPLKKIKKKFTAPLAAALSGISIEKVKKLIKSYNSGDAKDYYNDETFREYEFLVKATKTSGTNQSKLIIASDYGEYQTGIADKKAIVGIITIEGGHALSEVPNIKLDLKDYSALTDDQKRVIKNKYFLNIKKIKGLNTTNGFNKKHTPFWITLAHFFNNFLVGHAKSFKQSQTLIPSMDQLVDQRVGLDAPLTVLGRRVITRLLKRSQKERRILIDVKHMSLAGRLEYYDIVKKMRDNGDSVPIVFSHGGVVGNTKDTFQGFDSRATEYTSYLSKWSINLFDEDIQAIHESDGLIGLAPHEGRVPGGLAKSQLDAIRDYIGWYPNEASKYELLLHEEYTRIMLTSIFHIVSVIGKRSAWNMICLGSDYDGIMDPFDVYPNAQSFMRMFGDFKTFIDQYDGRDKFWIYQYQNGLRSKMPKKRFEDLMFNYSSRTIIDKMTHRNTELFLSKYFTTEYLHGKNMA